MLCATWKTVSPCVNLPKFTTCAPWPSAVTKRRHLDLQTELHLCQATSNITSPGQEQKIAQYLQESAVRHFGLSLIEAGRMAYQCILKFNITCSQSWLKKKLAGEGWLLRFHKRHKLSLRVAENTSLTRTIGFN